jgi:signal peptidase I
LTKKWELKPGDIVTFKYKGFWLGSGKPKSPTIHRLRLDKTWDEVVATFNELKSFPKGII